MEVTTPETASEGLSFIRSLQDVADILDEAPVSEILDDDDGTVHEALIAIAVALLTRDLAIANARNLDRPFRWALSRVFPNALIHALKEARDSMPEFEA